MTSNNRHDTITTTCLVYVLTPGSHSASLAFLALQYCLSCFFDLLKPLLTLSITRSLQFILLSAMGNDKDLFFP